MPLSKKFWDLAEHFMEVVHSETGYPVLVYDDQGIIVRATDQSRIGDRHAGAEKIMQGLVDEYAVTPEEAAVNPLVREGYSCPIVVGNQRVAAFGITGHLAQTKPLAKVAVQLIHSWIEEQAQQAQLVRSERKYRSIFDHSAQGIFQTTLDGRVLMANQALAAMYGYPSARELLADLTDVTSQLYVLPEDRRRLIARLQDEGHVTGFRARFRRRDGEIIDVSINAHFVAEPETGRRLIEGLVQDVTARRRAEEALRLSEEKYFKAFHNSPVLVVLSALETGRYIEVNETFERVMGYSRNELIGRTSLDIGSWVDPADRERIQAAIQKDGRIRGVEVKRRTKRGRILTVLFSAEIIDVDGEACMVSVTQDISERKRAEARLKDAHRRFLTVLDSIDATIYVADMDTFEILYMNQKMKQVFGEDFTGRDCFAVFRNEAQQCAVCTNDRLIDEDGNPTEGCVWESKNPVTQRWYVNYDRAIQWVDGRIVRLQVATDITKQKNIESERKDYEVRIQQMQKMEAIGVLAGGIAHDFNNILSAVIGFTELSLIDTPADTPVHGNLQQIHAAGMRARDLVQQILTFSRQDEKELQPLQIGSQVKEALKMLRSSLPTTIEMRVDIDAQVGNVMADPTQIHQIVMNLCTNAAQEMEARGGRLSVRLEQVALDADAVRRHPGLKAGEYARLSVCDTGAGIRADILDKIFNPYFTTKEKDKGTGLGLAVVHGIVQSFGGDIQVASKVGRGTMFEIYLPVIQAAAETPPRQVSLPMGYERILMVDDEAFIVEFGRQGLERLGYRVEGCTSSREALERFRQQPQRYDLVITDMTMPKMTGDQLAREIFKLRKGMPVILCTGYSSLIDGPQAEKMGIRALLMKPLNLSDLAFNIRQVLDASKGRHKPPRRRQT